MKFQNDEKAIIGLLIPGRSCTLYAMPIPQTLYSGFLKNPGTIRMYEFIDFMPAFW